MPMSVAGQFIEEGIVIGEAKGEVKTTIRALIMRFKSIFNELEEKLLATTDLERLDKLTDFAFDCNSLDEPKSTESLSKCLRASPFFGGNPGSALIAFLARNFWATLL